MGGIQPVSPCEPNPCHPGVKCTESLEGTQCGPCPDGMEGDGTRCTDVDEVCSDDSIRLNISIRNSLLIGTEKDNMI